MTITVQDLKNEVIGRNNSRIEQLKVQIGCAEMDREGKTAYINANLKELADLLDMEVCGEAIVEKSK